MEGAAGGCMEGAASGCMIRTAASSGVRVVLGSVVGTVTHAVAQFTPLLEVAQQIITETWKFEYFITFLILVSR